MSDYVLNKEQQQAVKYNNGPLLIIAGAGTGKTSVIVEKIKYLVKKKLAKPEQILALTFTEKAASEMEERVDKAMPYGYFQMNILTFHAFAEQILKENGYQIGLSPNYRLMTEAETIIFLKKNLFLFKLKYFRPLGNPNKFLEALLQHFSRLRDEDISPEEYVRYAQLKNEKLKMKNLEDELIERKKYLELATAYQTYQKLKLKEGLMDFADLVYYLLQLFHKRSNILKRYQQQYPFVLVDEFQDTNISQYQLIRLLCPTKKNPHLTVVGDDSQAIYKFRGASVSNIINFMKDYKKTRQITLKKNYRSNQTILDVAYKLIKNNDPDTLEFKLGISKNLVANKPDCKDTVNFYLAENVEEESDQVVNKIIKLSKTYKYSDFAILSRANNHSEPFIRSLSRAGIPFQFLGPGTLYKQPEVKDLIAYLKILYDLEDSPSLFRLLYMNIYSIDKKDVSLLLSFSKKINQSLFNAIEIYLSNFDISIHRSEYEIYKKYLPLLKTDTKDKLTVIYKMIIKHLELLETNTAGQILYYFLEGSGLLLTLTNYKNESQEKIAINISNFFNKLKMFESEHDDASVFAVVDFINMSIEMGESPILAKTDTSSLNAVNILTVHSAKGLEFPVVFLVNLTEERFPTRHKKETIGIPDALIKEILPAGDYHIQEERRLFYVGLTRAEDQLFLSSSKFYGEGKRQRKISRFVMETLGDEIVDKQTSIKKDEKSQLTIFDFKQAKQLEQGSVMTDPYRLPFTNNFSFSQLNSYKTCPLQYKYQYVLKIPTTSTAAESFGISIHQTLQKFYGEFMKNKKINEKDLLSIYKRNWIPIGYSTFDHQNRMKKEGEKILSSYFAKFHSNNLKVLALEKLFKIKISKDIFLTGKIDRVDKLNKNEIEIIDYKTGKKPVEREIMKSLQLSIYSLAAQDKNLFNKKLQDINLTFYYLQTPEKITLKKNQEELNDAKEEIINTAEEIRRNVFPANPGKHCDFCSFKIICEAWQ
ncbi:MAG: ATP-dependent DNA helicase [Patescibacteria group bacterium]